MKRIFLLIMFLGLLKAFPQTQVSGVQSGTWTKDNSPYLVVDTITVPTGDTLTIEAGVIIRFQGHYKFYVNGTLLALGTEEDTILFTADNPDEGWFGVRFSSQSENNLLRYCKFEYGTTADVGFPSQHGGAVLLDAAEARIEHCVFENNKAFGDDNGMGGAIYAINTSYLKISNCTFINNSAYGEGGAVRLFGDIGSSFDSCVFINNSVSYGGGAVSLYGCYSTNFFRCLFARNYTIYAEGGVAYISGYNQNIKFTNCTMVNNEALHGSGGAIFLAYSNAFITNSIIYNNFGLYGDNIYLDFMGYADINYSNTPVPDEANGTNNIDTDAMFVDTTNLDFHLQETSPCIDTAIDSLSVVDPYDSLILVVDMDSNDYYGVKPDMGAYEYEVEEPSAISITKNQIFIYPNPTKDILMINTNLEDYQIKIFDLSGHLLISEKNKNQIDLFPISAGIYLIYIQSDKTNKLFKLVKQ